MNTGMYSNTADHRFYFDLALFGLTLDFSQSFRIVRQTVSLKSPFVERYHGE